MSLETNLSSLATRIGTEFKDVRSIIGPLSALTTTEKATLVGAINEVNAKPSGGGDGGVVINDGVTNTTDAWSSQKIATEIATAIANLVDGAPETLDTLRELADALGDDPNFVTTITNMIGQKADANHTHVAADITDSTVVGRAVLTAADAAAARTAIGAGTSNLVIGTTAGTAKDGAYQPTSANISDATATGRALITAANAGAARTTLSVYSQAEIGNPETDFVATFEAAIA